MIVKIQVPEDIYAKVYFARGEQGPQGATGAQGPQGSQGPTGLTGPQGLTGPAGATGPQGATGAQGPAGTNGTNGTNGSNGVGYLGVTSTSSVPVAVGLHTWTVANVGAFLPGMRIRAIHTDTPSIWLEGPANVASGSTIIITADKVSGSGTHNTWKFAVAGEVGATGATGATGPAGANGQGVPTGGTAGQVLAKIDGTNYNTQWTTPSGGGGTPLPWYFPLKYISGVIYGPGNSAIQASSHLTTPRIVAWIPSDNVTFTKVSMQVQTALTSATTINWAIYDADSNYNPTTILYSGSLNMTTTVGEKAVTGLSISLTKGKVYFLGTWATVAPHGGLIIGSNAAVYSAQITNKTYIDNSNSTGYTNSGSSFPDPWVTTGFAGPGPLPYFSF